MNEHDLMVWAAGFYYCLGLTREQIARKLGRDEAHVWRLITEAKEKRRVKIAFDSSNAPWDELQRLLLPSTATNLPLKHLLENKMLTNHLPEELSEESLIHVLQQRTKAARNLRRVIVCDSGCKTHELRQKNSGRWTERIQTDR